MVATPDFGDRLEPQAAGTTNCESRRRASIWPASHRPSSFAVGGRLSQPSDQRAKKLTLEFHPLVTADASIFSGSNSSLSFANKLGSICAKSPALSQIPLSLIMSPTSCSTGRSTNGTSSRDSVGPKLSEAVWMVRRSGDAKTISTSWWWGKAALRARHCSLPVGVRTASRIV
jgi:hypothetical protein